MIIVMSVMNGFKTDLTKKILGLNPHIVVQSNSFKLDNQFIKEIEKKFSNVKISKTFSGEGVIIGNENAKGVIIKGIDSDKKENFDFLKNNLSSGSLNDFNNSSALIGAELAFNLNLQVGDKINLMSSSFVSTPLGNLPKQDTFLIGEFLIQDFLNLIKILFL